MIDKTIHTAPAVRCLRDPVEPFSPADELFRFAQLTRFCEGSSERGHLLEGRQYGFESLSLIITETSPGAGPPLYIHACEAAHIVLLGTATYLLGDQRFTVAGPYVVKIPIGIPHTFLNIGNQPIHLIAAFAAKQLSWDSLGPNPLIEW